MKIVIAGCGKIGTSIIKYLCKEGHSITVIDQNKELINSIINVYDVGGVSGSCTSTVTLKEANINKCNIYISVTGDDETNFVSCKVAKELGAKKTICRFRDTDYTEQAELMRDLFGIDMLVNPEFAVAKDLFYRLRFPYSSEVSYFEKGRVISVEVKIPEGSPAANKTISEFVENNDSKIIVGAILREDNLEIPNGESLILAGDVLNIISTPENIDSVIKNMGIPYKRVKSVLIVGGSRISYHLSNLLFDIGVDVKIVESSTIRCKELAERLNSNVEIVQADGTNEQVLAEEGIESYDACLTLTGHDEENILISLFAKTNGVGTVITKLNNDKLVEILDKLELNGKISPKKVTINQVLYFIRSNRAKEENTIEKLRKTMDDKLEILEFNVNGNDDFVSKEIKQLKIRPGVLIACIIRKGKIIIPSGEDYFDADDKVIVCAKSSVNSLDGILR